MSLIFFEMSLKKYDFCLEVGIDPSKRVTYHTFCGENLRNGVFFTSYSTLQSLAPRQAQGKLGLGQCLQDAIK